MKAVILIIFFCCSTGLSAQNLIGYSDSDIKQYMKENEKGFLLQSVTNNSTFRYLKYTDRRETQTLLFFLDPEMRCKTVRLVCEKGLKAQKINELDSRYKKNSDNEWIEIKNGITYLIDLRDEEVTFNITIRKKE